MNSSPSSPTLLAERVTKGDRRALARVISLIENGKGEAHLSELYPHTGNAHIIGITGAPGVGKSTLVGSLSRELVSRGKKVAVLAIDPSSPYSGGALLGDRIRMTKACLEAGVYIRSMSSRGSWGGIAPKTSDVLFAIDAAGFDYILLETVGVGQSEIEIVKYADTVAVVLVPGMGDGIQALKAGIIEIADIFVINKADMKGVKVLKKELLAMLQLSSTSTKYLLRSPLSQGEQDTDTSRNPNIISTIATNDKGLDELADEILRHYVEASNSGALELRRKEFLRMSFWQQLKASVSERLVTRCNSDRDIISLLKQLDDRVVPPVVLASKIAKKLLDED